MLCARVVDMYTVLLPKHLCETLLAMQ